MEIIVKELLWQTAPVTVSILPLCDLKWSKQIEAILKVSKMNQKLHKWTVRDGRGYRHKYDWTPYSSHEDDKDDEEDDKYAEYFDN